jgi:catechol 2,3-dioxygenase-like lactoylglutathione lyase family enzyme
MKRFHVNVGVADLDRSIQFYSTLFGEEPALVKSDYAKWMLEDPRVNFAINLSSAATGINHVGLQADTLEELGEIQERLHTAREQTLEQPDAECCYAKSTKTWVRDPDSVAWETFVTHDSITHYGDSGSFDDTSKAEGSRCCA